MSTFTVERVPNLSDEQFETLTAIYLESLSGDPASPSLTGGDLSLMLSMGHAIFRAGTLHGQLYIASDEQHGIVGFALWFPPGKTLFDTEEERQLGYYQFYASLSDAGKEWYQSVYFGEFPSFVAQCLGPTGFKDSWWLNMLAVRPEHRRKGISKALVNTVKQKTEGTKDVIALSTSNVQNVPIYEALGFELKGKKDIASPWGDWPLHVFVIDP